ncbi:N-acetylglucosaminyl-diphospho-decaprenol L-rhamnosyltransferase [Aeromicrobium sp. SORGH_AS981]|uniref:glycosyltransferase family 2 protein n=1 Tax=Aeromicrobium sp. SORGH_AS_0981 TaxID=3041802 RepID=UPI00285DF360|nr:glycosyltransferase family 2 protein [Aeromicrobium sp. SORGH_AS_0981]MDR6117563.1 N-acetylglucosaminyl-diphospho-decaprenol L-rhamnosyltransferase [Aeromicrobium sp. SORGH_AS_0981]
MTTERLGVVVVNYGTTQEVAARLPAGMYDQSVLIVLVDNFHSLKEQEDARRLAEDRGWIFIAHAENTGFGAACNAGAHRAFDRGCSHVLFLNPDASIDRSSLQRLWRTGMEHPDAMVSPVILRESGGSTWFSGGVLDSVRGRARHTSSGDVGREIDWLTAACLLVSRAAWERVGGFDVSYFLYWEDVDLTFRWKKLGGDLIVATDVEATHGVGSSQPGHRQKSQVYVFYNLANRGRFCRKNLSPAHRLWWLLLTPTYMFSMIRVSRPEPGGPASDHYLRTYVFAFLAAIAEFFSDAQWVSRRWRHR